MGLTDEIAESVNKLTTIYKRDYKEDEYEFSPIFKEMLFQMLKALYILQLPEYKMIKQIQLPSDRWIKNHIESLIEPDSEDDICIECKERINNKKY